MLCLSGNGHIVMVVSIPAAIRVAAEISTYLFYCLLGGGICGVCIGIGGRDIGWVVIVVVVMVRYWWFSEGNVGVVDCCYGGSCY